MNKRTEAAPEQMALPETVGGDLVAEEERRVWDHIVIESMMMSREAKVALSPDEHASIANGIVEARRKFFAK